MADMNTPRKYALKISKTLKNEGTKVLVKKSLKKVAQKLNESADKIGGGGMSSGSKTFTSIVDRRDVLVADSRQKNHIGKRKNPTMVVNWVISPPRSGGGHQNMFRFIEHLDKNGYQNNIYLYSTEDFMTLEEAKRNVSDYATLQRTNFYYYRRGKAMESADALFATGWETAYPVLNEITDAEKFYFVQDFEPLFYPVGTEYILAENTYRFGFTGITAGKWLSKKLTRDYGMKCSPYDFGAESDLYSHTNHDSRKEVFFYARPVTERRAFDLGIMVLELFHEKHPEYTINLAGWDVCDYKISFPYVNHKTLSLEELSPLYNKCAVGLVLSLTNMSLMPLELLASGVIPVVNDGENNKIVSSNKFISYASPTPRELAEKMSEVVSNPNQSAYAKQASKSVASDGWEQSKIDFLAIFEKELYV